jgi:molybdate transport system ATP-binding protein
MPARSEWLGPADVPGQGLPRGTGEATKAGASPVLTVRDKGKLALGQGLSWIIPSDGISLVDASARRPGDFSAEVGDARHLGEITLATLAIAEVPGAGLVLTLSGAQRRNVAKGARVGVRLDLGWVHVMPQRSA